MSDDAARIPGVYERHAQTWACIRRGLGPEQLWLDRFLQLLPSQPTVLDLGCGTGQPVARYLLGQGCAVTGIDTSQALLTIARTAMPQARWCKADMRHLDLGKEFHGLLMWNSSFHLTPEDQRQLFSVIAHHAAPKAAVMFTTGTSEGVSMGTFQGEPLYHASLSAQEYRQRLADHGFVVRAHVAEDPDCNGQTVWLAQRDQS